jgi:hypothetical protein
MGHDQQWEVDIGCGGYQWGKRTFVFLNAAVQWDYTSLMEKSSRGRIALATLTSLVVACAPAWGHLFLQ